MCSGAGHTTWLVRGSPIRTSSDQRSVGSSPRLLAASHVLHRLLVPRHPPCALNNLTTQQPHRVTTGRNRQATGRAYTTLSPEFKRCSRPLCSSQRTTSHRPTTPRRPPPPSRGGAGATRTGTALNRDNRPTPRPPGRTGGPLPQDPTACLPPNPPRTTAFPAPPRRTAPYKQRLERARPNWSAFHPRAPPQTPAARHH